MGQYFYVVNEDKREYLHPHVFGDGMKLGELRGTLRALAWLLADNDDVPRPHRELGSWKGDRITVAGDYGPTDRENSSGEMVSLHRLAEEEFADISRLCMGILDL